MIPVLFVSGGKIDNLFPVMVVIGVKVVILVVCQK